MKVSSQDVVAALSVEKSEPGIVADLMALTKARLTFLVLITTFVGFCMASGGPLDWLLLFYTLLGTALVAGSAAVLNQAVEMKVDRLMERTRDRPLPAGRMKQETAFVLGGGMAALGLAVLALSVSPLTVLLAGATLAIYVLVYTPMKRVTSLCVVVGAVSGAIPPVIGWTAADPKITGGALVLFGVLFLWQMPHFLSIAWMYRDEYATAGFRMLKEGDTSGSSTALRALSCTVGLLTVGFVPVWLGIAGFGYLAIAVVLNALFLACAVKFSLQRTRASARQLFFASIFYLPLLLGLMVFTRR